MDGQGAQLMDRKKTDWWEVSEGLREFARELDSCGYSLVSILPFLIAPSARPVSQNCSS